MSHLILADPWGFPEPPKDISTVYNVPWYIRSIFHVAKGFNPLAAFRGAGPWGYGLIKRMRPDLIRRFSRLFDSEEENFKVVPDYMYHCNAQTPT